jgi:tetratricopeptide (TPR) repeat protein
MRVGAPQSIVEEIKTIPQMTSCYRIILLLVAILTVSSASAQSDREYIRRGNRLYRDSTFNKAETEYRKALSKNPRNAQAMYNLGNALLMQQKPKEAMQQYENAAKLESSRSRRAKIYHNMGVILQSQKQYGEAIKCYEQSLINNPADDETRYNLALCQKLNKNGNNKQNKQNNKNDKKNKNNKNKDQKQNQNKNQNKDKQNQKQQQDKNQMSKDNAEQLLNAAIQNEKATQDKLKKAMQQPRSRKLDKNW